MGMELYVDSEELLKEEPEEEVEEVEEGFGTEMSEQPQRDEEGRNLRVLKLKPGVLVVGPPDVGKRTLVSRLIGRGRSAQATSESGATCRGWTVDTKYYTANLCVWSARLGNPTFDDAASIQSEFGRCEALVMVFDLSSAVSFEQLQEWVEGVELEGFQILLCVGNKADRVPEHFGHAEYRRKLQKSGESSSDPHPEFLGFGIDGNEGSSLLDKEGVSVDDRRRSCIEWCSERGIEYIEACAINEVFDECMSVDGDLQGVPRIHGALCAHMWPGLIMKDKSEGIDAIPSNQEQEDITSDDDSDYYIEYELLSNGSAEAWEVPGWEEQWNFSSNGDGHAPEAKKSSSIEESDSNFVTTADLEVTDKEKTRVDVPEASESDHSYFEISSSDHVGQSSRLQNGHINQAPLSLDTFIQNAHKNQEIDDMEQLMNEMASMRTNMQFMSDRSRREMAAQLALRMASMFKEEGDELDVTSGM